MKNVYSLLVAMFCSMGIAFGQTETEPNDSPSQADVITLNAGFVGGLTGSDINDWYELNITRSGIVTLTFQKTGNGNGTLYLRDGEITGEPELTNMYISFSESPAAGWTLSYPLLAGKYYIQVNKNTDFIQYTLTATQANSGYNEDLEPNGSLGQSLGMPPNGTISGNLHYYGAGEGFDLEDWYRIEVPQAGILQLTIRKKGAGNAWMYFKDGEKAGNPDISSFYFEFGDAPVAGWTWSYPLLAGTYYFQITGGGNVVDYQIESQLMLPAYPEDAEPNAGLTTALTMSHNGIISGNLHYYGAGEGFDTEDWYKMVVPQAGILQLTIRKKGAGNAWMYFKDGEKAGNPDISSFYFEFGDAPVVGWTWSYPLLAGTYYFQISGGGNVVDYQIESRLTSPAFPEDTEPNNQITTALAMLHDDAVSGNLRYYGAGEGFDMEDWYKMEVPQGGILTLVIHKKGPGNAWLYFLDGEKAGNPEISNFYIGYWESPPEGWSWSYPVLAGTYYFRLANGEYTVDYRLNSKLTPPAFGEDKEPNDTLTVAQVFPVNDSLGGTLGFYNPGIGIDNWDWFAVTTAENGLLSFTITKKGGNNGNIRLRNATGEIGSHYMTFGDLNTRFSKIVPAGTYYLGFEKFSGDFQYKVVSDLLPVPVADFTYQQTVNVFAFENISRHPATYRWNFDDGQFASTTNAYHEYDEPGNFNVCLIATNAAGSDTMCRLVILPGVARVLPAEGGNTGDVTVQVFGGGLDTNYMAKIMDGNTEIAASNVTGIAGLSSITVRFDLRNKPVGVYDLVIQKMGGNPSYILPKGFSIIPGTKPDVWANIVGRNRILFNTSTTYTLNYGNKGNVDAVVAPIWLAVHDGPNLVVSFPEAIEIKIDTFDLGESIEKYVLIDSLFGNPGKWRVYSFLFPVIKAGSNNSMKMKIKTSEDLKILAWAEKSWFQSPIDADKEACVNEAIDSVDVDLIAEILKECVKNAVSETFYKLATFWIVANSTGNYAVNGILITSFRRLLLKAAYSCGVKGKDEVSQSIRNEIANQVYSYYMRKLRLKKNFLVTQNISLRENDVCSIALEPQNPTETSMTAVNSLDPNEKAGPDGYGPDNYLRTSNGFPYTVLFENKSSASAPAHQVVVTDQLDPEVFDLQSFRFGHVVIGDSTLYIPEGSKSFSLDKALSNRNVITRVQGNLDTLTGKVEWLFRSLDPISLDDVEDPDIGFLPPNINKPEGEGAVTFFVKLKNPPRHGDKIKNKASIVFDANPAIITNEHVVTFDLHPPSSTVDSVVSILGTEQIRVVWSGSDGDSGLKSYYIYSINNHKDTVLWLGGTTETSGVFRGQAGGTFSFYSIAVDNAGNVEKPPVQPDGSVTISDTDDEGKNGQALYLYPNPTDGQLTIVNSGTRGGCLTLMQADGQVVTRFYLKAQGSQQVDLSGVPEGLLQWLWAIDCSANLQSGRVVIIR